MVLENGFMRGFSIVKSLLALAALALLAVSTAAVAGPERARHGIAMHGEPGLPADFGHLPYADPAAPMGGRITLALQGTFDSLNPLIVLGVAPDVVPRYVLQSLMMRSQDEPFTLYGLVARNVEMPEDRGSVTFNLDQRARFSDGHPLTAEDVKFTFELLRRSGKPFYRSAFGSVKVSVEGPHRIRFDMSGANDRELPLLIGLMPIFAAHATDPSTFDRTTLTPPVGSGPYRIKELRPGERVVLERRADFWGENLPILKGFYNFKEIRYDFYRDANTMFEAFKAGLYDYRTEGEPGRWAKSYDFTAIRDGRLTRETFENRLPKGMNGFVFNTRKEIFRDVRVREAIGYLFDFEWVNRNLFFGLLERSTSYFAASDLSAYQKAPSAEERRLLAPFADAIPPDILEGRWILPAGDGSGRDRENAQKALDLLGDAGWEIRGGTLRHKRTGERFSFELLVNSRQQERLALNFSQSLGRVGIEARVRLVDDVQYWRRLGHFDFDMIQWLWPASASPGNEQRNRWGSAAVARDGSFNFAGASSPALDGMIDAILEAESREAFVGAVRALDRVLMAG
jgi:peptide/nickel transport system substrate-binding protein